MAKKGQKYEERRMFLPKMKKELSRLIYDEKRHCEALNLLKVKKTISLVKN